MAFEKKESVVSEEQRPLFGRNVLYSSHTNDNLSADEIAKVLEEVIPLHFQNVQDIQYLQGYYRGNQKILSKTKLIRPEINNKVLENHAYYLVEFKKGYEFGDPIQYIQRGDGETKAEIEILNRFMVENDKASKDKDLSEDWFICGTSYRFVRSIDDENKPFEFFNVDPKSAAVVYSTDIDRKPLFGFYIVTRNDGQDDYWLATAYTKTKAFTFKIMIDREHFSSFKAEYLPETVKEKESNWLGMIPIIEYPLNKSRFGIVELSMATLDALNKVSSNDIDDIEQFVQALLVILNAEVDLDNLGKAKQAGALMLKDVPGSQNKSDVKSISNKLLHSETKVLYDRLYNNMLTIAGVPRMSDKVSSGDTGQARLVGEGWTMADERAKQDELSFKMAEKKFLDIVLHICRVKSSVTKIKQLKTSEVEIKFTRNKSENMLVKAQTLLNLKTAQIDPEIAFRSIDMWSDPAEVLRQSQAFYGDDFWKPEQVEMSNQNTVAQGQDGEVQNVTGVDAQ